MLIVQKYGGTSVGNTDRIKNVAARVAKYHGKGDRIVVVVSAMSGVTDNLIKLAKEIMPLPNEREMDVLLATGEQTTIALAAIALHSLGIPAVSLTGAQAVVRSLEVAGVDTVFGIPGGTILPAYDPLLDSTKLRHILVRHEQGAGHAAEGYAYSSGKVGVATANTLLFPPGRWQLADWDDETQLFLRPGTPGWSADPYRLVEPESGDPLASIEQDVAVIPFLWVLPLALYLVSFIISFDSPRWYRRSWFGPALATGAVLPPSVVMMTVSGALLIMLSLTINCATYD